MIGRVNTGGGIKLPFRVVGGTKQPSNPKDGTIWVKTSVPITHLEFNNDTWASGGVGMVFISGMIGGSNPTGTNNVVYVLNTKAGGIIHREKVILTGCKQVQGSTGNWVNLDAYRYYGGKWVQFSSASVIPEFTYTGDYEIVNDADEPITTSQDNWKIRFLTSGILKFQALNGAENGIDVFLVGGGGGGHGDRCAGGGGGGGYTTTGLAVSVDAGKSYEIYIGAGGAAGSDGGNSSAFGLTADGGKDGGTNANLYGGNGGSGGGGFGHQYNAGNGGSDGSNAASGYYPGKGQGTTTREFGDPEARLYSGGGGGGTGSSFDYGKGGAGGGGNGGKSSVDPTSGTANTGGGGGGGPDGSKGGAAGGSGIVIIRNRRPA